MCVWEREVQVIVTRELIQMCVNVLHKSTNCIYKHCTGLVVFSSVLSPHVLSVTGASLLIAFDRLTSKGMPIKMHVCFLCKKCG